MGYEKRYAHYDLSATQPAPLVPRNLRFTVADRPGVLAEITAAMRDAGV